MANNYIADARSFLCPVAVVIGACGRSNEVRTYMSVAYIPAMHVVSHAPPPRPRALHIHILAVTLRRRPVPSRRGRQSSSAEPKKKQTPQEVSVREIAGCCVCSVKCIRSGEIVCVEFRSDIHENSFISRFPRRRACLYSKRWRSPSSLGLRWKMWFGWFLLVAAPPFEEVSIRVSAHANLIPSFPSSA